MLKIKIKKNRQLTEAAKSHKDLQSSNKKILITQDKSNGLNIIKFSYSDKSGFVEIQRDRTTRHYFGPCSDAWIVAETRAKKGWGPMLYDLAMEWATKNGGGLTPDRVLVSKSARNVWRYYQTQRSDVQSHQLDDMDNTLTPPLEDNCLQDAAREPQGKKGKVLNKKIPFTNSPLSKRWTKQPSLMPLLFDLGLLEDRT